MGYVKCCVPGCEDKTSARHRLPNPSKDMHRLKLWLDALQDQNLYEMYPMKLYEDKRVCHRHFDACDFSVGSSRVHRNAVPTLYLQGNNKEAIAKEVPANQALVGINLSEIAEVQHCGSENQAFSSVEFCGEATSNQQVIPAKAVQTPRDILKEIGFNTVGQLTPKKRLLYRHIRSAHSKIQRTLKAKNSFKERLQVAEKFSATLHLEKNLDSLNSAAAAFIRCQFRECCKSSKQHRYNQDEKIFALALYKQSPRAFRFLSKIFTLPSKGTLDKLLNNILFETGIMPHVFKALEAMTKNMNPADRYVSIIFDEMAITPAVHYNEQKGYIHGFEDMGGTSEDRPSQLADHVLVFMLRGIKKNFKQPLAYAFSSGGGAKYAQIKELLLKIINLLLRIGLNPITTICDQSATNCKLVKSLLEDTKGKYLRRGDEYRGDFFEVGDFKIFPIYDPPHLMKGIRNNFLNKAIQFGKDGAKRIAKWSHIIALYEHDNGPNVEDGLRALPQLTDEHVYENKMKKMKVKFATQIFSQRVAATLRLASSLGSTHSELREAAATADLLYFFDQLFDSMNGSKKSPAQGKILRCGISTNSNHLRFWQNDALPMLSSMEYIKVNAKHHKVPPSLCNWMFTIRNFINIWNVLKDDGIQYMLGRHLNQDPIENFFGQIRSQGVRYTKPTCAAFIGAFKSLLINKLFQFHKPTFNCEDDKCASLFDELQFLFTGPNPKLDSSQYLSLPLLKFCDQGPTLPRKIDSQLVKDLGMLSNNYVAGFILKKLRKVVASCKACNTIMFTTKADKQNDLIVAREYGGGWHARLRYPTLEFADAFRKVHSVISAKLKQVSSSKRLADMIREAILQNVDFSFLKCEEHNIHVLNSIIKLSMRTLIHAWCKDVNRKLCGKDARPYYGSDTVKINAIIKCSKNKKK